MTHQWYKILPGKTQEVYVWTTENKPTLQSEAPAWLRVTFEDLSSKVQVQLFEPNELTSWDAISKQVFYGTIHTYRGNFLGLEHPKDPVRKWVNRILETPMKMLAEGLAQKV